MSSGHPANFMIPPGVDPVQGLKRRYVERQDRKARLEVYGRAYGQLQHLTVDRLVEMARPGASRAVIARHLGMPRSSVNHTAANRVLTTPCAARVSGWHGRLERVLSPMKTMRRSSQCSRVARATSSLRTFGRNHTSIGSRLMALLSLQRRGDLDLGLTNIKLPSRASARRPRS